MILFTDFLGILFVLLPEAFFFLVVLFWGSRQLTENFRK
jgi:Na+-transporting NADH:ubiquinone oxidoreductase subunit NqrD